MRVQQVRLPLLWIFLVLSLSFLGAESIRAQVLGVTEPAGATSEGSQAETDTLSADKARLLADLLRDPAVRDALISELENAAQKAATAVSDGGQPPASEDSGSSAAEATEETPSFIIKIAKFTQDGAERIAEGAAEIWDRLLRAPENFEAIYGLDVGVLLDALWDLALVIVITVSVFLVLRFLARRLDRALGRIAGEVGVLRTAFLIVARVVIDVLVVVLAWASGYLLTLTAFGSFGSIEVLQTLYLNAFLIIELSRVALRALLSPTAGQLRLVPITDHAAKLLATWLGVVIEIVGYGNLLVVPYIKSNISYFAGVSVSALLSLIALIILSALVLANRRDVSAWLSSTMRLQPKHRLLRFLARTWHVPCLIYLVMLCVMVITNPGGTFLPVIIASGKILAAIVVGAMVATILKAVTARGVHLPQSISTQLPLLETRLNAFVPKFLFMVRYVILLTVIAFTVHTLELVDVEAWLSSQVGAHLAEHLISVSAILLVCFAFWLGVASWVDYRISPDVGRPASSREATLLTLARNAFTAILVVFALMFSLSHIGIDIAPLLASAGVFGLAIGFGAQKLVQDVITGIFIQFENAMNVGDVVSVGGITGTIERLTIRSVSLRDLDGVFHLIPFSSIDMVSNYMRGFAYHVANIGIAYRESIDDAKLAMHDAFAEMVADPEWRAKVMGELEWFGLTAFGDSAINVRGRIKCLPGTQWAVGRRYNEHIKKIFDERNIEIPFPHQTIYFGEDKEGKAPPMHMVMERRKRGRGKDEPATDEGLAEAEKDLSKPSEDAPNDGED